MTSASSAGLELVGLSKRFGDTLAVDDVTFAVPPGQTWGLIGPNGAGKTTCFNLVSGFLRPTTGDVMWRGESVARYVPAARARRGIVRSFQQARTFTGLTVHDHLLIASHLERRSGFLADLAGTPSSRRAERAIGERADELVATYGLDTIVDRPAASLPYGLKKRLGFIMALAPRPSILLLDEPAAGLNFEEVATLRGDLDMLRETDITVLLVEHNMGLAMKVCQMIVVLDAGRILAQGEPRDVADDEQVKRAYLGSRK